MARPISPPWRPGQRGCRTRAARGTYRSLSTRTSRQCWAVSSSTKHAVDRANRGNEVTPRPRSKGGPRVGVARALSDATCRETRYRMGGKALGCRRRNVAPYSSWCPHQFASASTLGERLPISTCSTTPGMRLYATSCRRRRSALTKRRSRAFERSSRSPAWSRRTSNSSASARPSPPSALLERKGALTGLLTTKGFRDLLEIGRQKRPHPYDMLARETRASDCPASTAGGRRANDGGRRGPGGTST